MNFLNIGGCLPRNARVPFRPTPCCRDILKQVGVVDVDSLKTPQVPRKATSLVTLKPQSCCRILPRLSHLAYFTQVRFKDSCPKLHRDLPFPNFDKYRKKEFTDIRKTSWGSGDQKYGYTYVMGFFGFMGFFYGLKGELIHYVTFMGAAADVLAMAQVEVDISKVEPGGCISYKWRGKPLFIKNRSPGDIEFESKTPLGALRDPESEEQRTQKPQWLIVIGICTHLGCVPIPNAGDYSGGFYCPCHGSHYDNIGRIRKGPAPINLEVPPYKFLSDTTVLVG